MAVQNIPVARSETQPASTRSQGGTMGFGGLRDEVDRLFDQFTSRFWNRPFDIQPFSRSEMAFGSAMPAVDVAEKDGAYEISAELPGLDPKDVQVSISNGMLTVSGEKTEEKEEKDKNYRLSERRFGSFRRSFQLPDGIDTDRIDAKFEKGVLTVTLPKNAAAAQKKTIEVKAS